MSSRYVLDKDNFKIKRLRTSWTSIFFRCLKYLAVSVSLAVLYYILFALVFSTDTERRLKQENRMYEKMYPGMREKEALLGDVVSSLGQRDNGIYEEIFHSPSPSSPDFGYADFASAGDSISSDAGIVIYTEKKLSEAVAGAGRVDEALKYIMSRSIELRDSLPPLSLPLKNLIFDHTGASVGQKINPFYKVNSMHEGLDFVVPSGTPVYAPADGVVLSVTRSTRGAGNVVEIDHGNGFLTRYAHLQEIHVRKGRLIGKGDRIGLSGMSGKSFGPHLHYEVWRDGKVMDPLNFFFADLTPEEYAGMMALGTSIAQSMD